MKIKLTGTDCMPSISGGYLLVTLDGEEVATVGVPSPNFADRHSDSVNDNYDDFEDSEGNQYSVTVWSSNVGVDWEVEINSLSESDLESRIDVEYQSNDY
ncbi:TPA: hypothetical protein ACPVXX_004486 [Vibrio parahaemolyticus]